MEKETTEETIMVRASSWEELDNQREMCLEIISCLVDMMEEAIDAGDWIVDSSCNPEIMLMCANELINESVKIEP